MSQRMHQFTTVGQSMPKKRKSEERAKDFGEIYQGFAVPKAAEQSSRCEQCGIPFCHVNCPLNNNIPDWLLLTTEGRLEDAYAVSQATNNFPEITGRICPQDRLCEGACVLEQSTHDAVTIGSVEKFITDHAFAQGWIKPIKPAIERSESVGIIGAGPAGLAAAEELRKRGFEVHVYDRHDRVGGLLVYGIPNFKLDKEIVKRRADLMIESGVTFHLSFEVGKDATLAELRAKHDAVLIATGVYKAHGISVPGNDLGGVVQALDYLIASNRSGLGDKVPEVDSGQLDARGKNVVVIGGGDTAMDCVRTAIRQGATSVKCLYRRDRANMPGSARETQHAEEEGVEFVWQSNPEAFLGEKNVSKVRAVKMHLGMADESGRQRPQPVEGSQFDLDADLVVMALGFAPEDLPGKFGEADLATSDWATLTIDNRSKETSLDGVFAAGDIVRGASLVVWAIRDGREAAEGIRRYIDNKVGSTRAQLAAAS
jgi:glutamate synthase (NADPH/NADH) small chain